MQFRCSTTVTLFVSPFLDASTIQRQWDGLLEVLSTLMLDMSITTYGAGVGVLLNLILPNGDKTVVCYPGILHD